MTELNEIQSAVSKILGSRNGEASIFFIGSAKRKGGPSFISGLSDIDLFVVPPCNSLVSYKEWLEATINLSGELNQSNEQLFDVFLLSKRIAGQHFACLSILAGRIPSKSEAISGDSSILVYKNLTSEDFYRKMYQAKEQIFSDQCVEQFPVADTSKARKTAKLLLYFLKVFVCTYDLESNLSQLEEELFDVKDFSILQKRIEKLMQAAMPDLDVFQEALDREKVSDWPAWMIAQEELVYWILSNKPKSFRDKTEERFFKAICEVRDMLMLDLKGILHEQDVSLRQEKISEYVDKTASVLVKLALCGAPALADLTNAVTPLIVRQSYDMLVSHLKSARTDEMCLAAAVVLLEYALEESVIAG